ncbi:C40 family peptidase [Lactobacillus gasseri]|uniref:C40 family peptidase n=1 Tax=Lactobacillus gasseri TaxID=1596 RepID=UPI0018DFF219|nr:C40 family peptidase [Lactobacillus gasseri]
MTIKSKVIKLTTAASFAVAGIATLSAAKLNSLSFNSTAQASTVQAPAKQIGVVKVNSKTGESVAVWNSYEDGKQQTGKYLPHESSWKTYKKVKTVKGETWYNLGGDQWISGDDVQEEAPIALTADLSAVKAAVSQVPATNTTATAQTAVASVNNAQQASVATAPVQTNTAANAQQTSATAQAPVAQTAAQQQQSTYTASTNNTYVAPAKTNYYAQANTTVKTQQAATYSAPAQNTTAAKPAQQQTQQASSQAAQPAKQQASSQAAQPAKQQASTQSSSTAQTVVNAAKSQIGKPYVWGATGPNAYDCSGLVQYAYSQAGKNIGRTTYQQVCAGQHVSVSQAQAGDILMWGDYHDAIYVGNNQYVHAPQPGQNVTQATISSYFMPDYAIRVR